MYTFKSRVRYSEADSGGRLGIFGILNYLQDCSSFQAEELGIGMEYLGERHIAWVLSYWQVDILRRPAIGEYIEIGTSPYDVRGFFGYRNFFIRDEDGEMAVKANSVWTLVDIRSMRPVRVTKEMTDAYELSPKLDMEYLDRKIRVPEAEVREAEPFTVKRHNIDTNRHVNNAQYVCAALDYAGDTEQIFRVRAEYKRQALLGDRIYPSVTDGGAWEKVSLRAEDGNVFADVLFEYKG